MGTLLIIWLDVVYGGGEWFVGKGVRDERARKTECAGG
jgi:hypothetical protein